MKKSLLFAALILCFAAFTNQTKAQDKGSMAVGGNLAFSTGNDYTNFGLGAKFQYNVLKPLRLEGSFTYFFESDNVAMWDLSVNAHWLFNINDKFAVYPLGGLCFVHSWMPDFNNSGSTAFCLNLGGGVDYKLTDKLFLNAEVKYKIDFDGDWSRLMLSVGIGYRL